MRKRILIIDDQLFDVTLTRQVLLTCGVAFDIIAAFDGYEGLTLLESRAFDVVLLDLKMPKVDGFEVLAEMRAHCDKLKIPVVVLSNSNLESDRIRAEDLGAVDYVHKAMEFVHFHSALKTALTRLGLC